MADINWTKSSVTNRWAEIGSVEVNVTTIHFPGQTMYEIGHRSVGQPGRPHLFVARLPFDPSDEIVMTLLSAAINASVV